MGESTGDYYTACPDLYQGAKVDAAILASVPGGRTPPNDHVFVTEACERVDINQLCREGNCPLLNPTTNGLDFFESLGTTYTCC